MGDGVRVRVPLVEAGLDIAQRAFTFGSRSLNPDEKKLLLGIFGPSINLDAVELAYTNIAKDGRAYTLGNTIHIPEHMPKGATFDASTLVHEMTHVWQYQTRGTGYLSDSIFHQLTQGNAAYDLELVPGKSFYDYTAEQEAMIVQKYYDDSPPGWRQNRDVVVMIGQIQQARPLSDTQAQQERWFGPNVGMPDNPIGGEPRLTTVPLIRIEF